MDARDQEVIDDIRDRLGNGRPPCEPEHFDGTVYEVEDDYYERYEVGEAAGDADGVSGAAFTARDGDRAYLITVRRRSDAETRDVAAVLSADPDQGVRDACHAGPRLRTLDRAEAGDDSTAYVVSRGDLACIAGRAVTDREVARIVKAIDNGIVMEAIGDAVWQAIGLPGGT